MLLKVRLTISCRRTPWLPGLATVGESDGRSIPLLIDESYVPDQWKGKPVEMTKAFAEACVMAFNKSAVRAGVPGIVTEIFQAKDDEVVLLALGGTDLEEMFVSLLCENVLNEPVFGIQMDPEEPS